VSARASKDRRVLRTRRALRLALLAEIAERGWDAVSVQDVCARADVGRSTFYTHFADKEELFLSGLHDLQVELRRAIAESGGEPLAFVRPMIEHIQSHGRDDVPPLRAILDKRGGQVAIKRLIEMLVELLHDELSARMPPGPRREAIVRYLAGASVELFIWWSNARHRMPADELEQLYRRMTMAALRAGEVTRAAGAAARRR
jgi:AcrR family transcriptional regulator